jgi:reactive intermediate/imine deaminase
MARTVISTEAAPAAIGAYSQAVSALGAVYCSGQIALDPQSGELVDGGAAAEIRQVFKNLAAVAQAAGGSLADAVKLTVYLTDLGHFALVNEVMGEFFEAPFPARAAIGVAALPRGAAVEVDAILVL